MRLLVAAATSGCTPSSSSSGLTIIPPPMPSSPADDAVSVWLAEDNMVDTGHHRPRADAVGFERSRAEHRRHWQPVWRQNRADGRRALKGQQTPASVMTGWQMGHAAPHRQWHHRRG